MGKKKNKQVSTERLVIDPNKFKHRMDSEEIEGHLHTRLKGRILNRLRKRINEPKNIKNIGLSIATMSHRKGG